MEHKSGIDSSFFPDDDFEQLLKEKTDGWQKAQSLGTQSVSEILSSQKIVPHISETKRENPVNVVEEVSSQSISSSEIQDVEVPNQSSDAPNVNESLDSDSPTLEDTEEKRQIQSDPEFSRDIIEGKMQRVKIRGIEKGPWARQQVVVETVSPDKILDSLGYKVRGDKFLEATRKAQELNDIEKVVEHIDRLNDLAFDIEWEKRAYVDHLTIMIETGSEAERKKAESAYAKLFKNQSARVLPDGKRTKAMRPDGVVEVREKAAPKEKMLKETGKTIDLLITLGLDYSGIVERLKGAGKLNQPAIDYIKEQLKGKV